MIEVAIVDHPGSGAVAGDLPRIAAALQRQVREHFAPRWHLEACSVVATLTPAASSWVIDLLATGAEPGELGHHETTPAGLPRSKVYPLLDAQDGVPLSATISHELLEMLADPYLTRSVQTRDGTFWALEVCDAVEQDTYSIDGVLVSNFVTPAYFEPPVQLAGVELDILGMLARPLEVRPGGYMQRFDPSKGWVQVLHAERAPRSYRQRAGGRVARRRAP